jgi:hypothetical protein
MTADNAILVLWHKGLPSHAKKDPILKKLSQDKLKNILINHVL